MRAIAHPLFHGHYPDSIRYDIGIITLCNEMKFNEFQKPVKLSTRRVKDGQKAIVSGWSHTKTEKSSEILQQLVTRVYTARTCTKWTEPDSFSDGNRICTKCAKGKGFCSFDNGSPLVVDGVVVGIASLLYGCRIEEIDQYANVYKGIKFISEEMQSGCSPSVHSFLVEKNNDHYHENSDCNSDYDHDCDNDDNLEDNSNEGSDEDNRN